MHGNVISMSNWMTRQEAADYLRTTTKTIDRNAAKGLLTRYYLGGSQNQPRFKCEELDALMSPEADPTRSSAEEYVDEEAEEHRVPNLCDALIRKDREEWLRIHKATEAMNSHSACFACA